MQQDTEQAFAKINLALHVRTRRADGYHDIETLFAFVDQGDRISVQPSETLSLTVEGRFRAGLEGDDNLILRAARLLRESWKIDQGAALTLDKRLPVASGIGGGSADAAATARLLNRFWNIGADHRELAEMLAPLGADIPACLFSLTARGEGTGTALAMLDSAELKGVPTLLVNPLKPVSTAQIFSAWDGRDRGALGGGDILEAALSGRNDLQPMAVELCPEIAVVLDALAAQKPMLARMSGSGATCFALFGSEAERDVAGRRIAIAHPDWWIMEGELR